MPIRVLESFAVSFLVIYMVTYIRPNIRRAILYTPIDPCMHLKIRQAEGFWIQKSSTPNKIPYSYYWDSLRREAALSPCPGIPGQQFKRELKFSLKTTVIQCKIGECVDLDLKYRSDGRLTLISARELFLTLRKKP